MNEQTSACVVCHLITGRLAVVVGERGGAWVVVDTEGGVPVRVCWPKRLCRVCA